MINLNNDYQKIDAYTRGRKEKIWFVKDNQKYLYKYGASNYEIYAELIAEQLGKQIGISMANYQLATYKGTIGVLSKSFIKPGELIYSADKLKKAVQSIYEENNLNGNLNENTISNLIEAAFTYDSSINTDKLFLELAKRWMFYGLIMESDKNDTNISFIRKKTRLTLSPDYDNSTMARLNENIISLISNIKNQTDIYIITDNIKQSLKPTSKCDDNFLSSLRFFATEYPEITQNTFESFKNIDIEKAISKVETYNKIEVPWEIHYYLNKTISLRYQDMESIINLKNDKNISPSKK